MTSYIQECKALYIDSYVIKWVSLLKILLNPFKYIMKGFMG